MYKKLSKDIQKNEWEYTKKCMSLYNFIQYEDYFCIRIHINDKSKEFVVIIYFIYDTISLKGSDLMRYEIAGFKQQELINLEITMEEGFFLRMLVDTVGITNDDKYIYSISYEEIKERFLFGKINSEEVKKKKIRKLFNGKLSQIVKFICCVDGNYLFSIKLEEYNKILA